MFHRVGCREQGGEQAPHAQVAGAKALREYALEHEVATGGLNALWKIFSARSRKEGARARADAPQSGLCTAGLSHPRLHRNAPRAGALNKAVSVWVVDKRPQGMLGALSPTEREAVLAVARADAQALSRMKHPAIVQVGARCS